MSTILSRTDTSILGRWWWTVDRWLLVALWVLVGMGVFLVAAASPAVAQRLRYDPYYFVWRHVIYLLPSILIMLGMSLLSPRSVRRVGFIVLLGAICMMALVPVIGTEVKGAHRWLRFGGMSIQPSEFAKPAFAIVCAWLFSRHHEPVESGRHLPGIPLAMGLFGLMAMLLLMQPDMGMTVVFAAIWSTQFFMAGLPLPLIGGLAGLGVLGFVGAYTTFSHVQSRVDRFLDPTSGDSYQISRSLQAFGNGGAFGVGPGQGTVKFNLPDAHADFIFSVAGEEMGLICTSLLVGLFVFIVLRAFTRMNQRGDLFSVLAVGGLIVQFGLQAMIHMASSLHLMPTKGMTLPFVSYGGSSLLALGFGMGAVLALTRKHLETEKWR